MSSLSPSISCLQRSASGCSCGGHGKWRSTDGVWCLLQRGYEGEWLGGTFSKAVFFGNGLMAILAGLIAQSLVGVLNAGPVAPFDAAAVVMVLGGAIVLISWPENYGDVSDTTSFFTQLNNAKSAIRNGGCLAASLIRS
jgi:hypothetical protein